MQSIQEIFDRIQEKKKELKDLRNIIKDAFEHSQEYQEITQELKVLKQKKKEIEEVIKQDLSEEITKIEDLKIDIATDQELLQDIALTKMMQGEQVKIVDKNKTEYEPVFSVKFKRV